MTTLALAPVDASPTVKFGNLLRAESRKLVNSLTAKILLAVIAALSLAVTILIPLAALDQIREAGGSWHEFVEIAASGPSIFVPLLAIMLFTAEWSQNSVLSTFVSEPRRGRVLFAKAIATFVLAIVTWLLSQGVGAATALVFDHAASLDLSWAFEWERLAGSLIVFLLVTFQASALGLLLMSTPLAIVVYLLIPNVLGVLQTINPDLGKYTEWISPTAPSAYLSDMNFDGDNVWRLLTCIGLWVLLPGIIGWIRQMRAEVS